MATWRTHHKRARRPRIDWKDFERHMRLLGGMSNTLKSEMRFVTTAAKSVHYGLKRMVREHNAV